MGRVIRAVGNIVDALGPFLVFIALMCGLVFGSQMVGLPIPFFVSEVRAKSNVGDCAEWMYAGNRLIYKCVDSDPKIVCYVSEDGGSPPFCLPYLGGSSESSIPR